MDNKELCIIKPIFPYRTTLTQSTKVFSEIGMFGRLFVGITYSGEIYHISTRSFEIDVWEYLGNNQIRQEFARWAGWDFNKFKASHERVHRKEQEAQKQHEIEKALKFLTTQGYEFT